MVKRMLRKPLSDAPEGQCFWVNNGPVLKNVVELERALKDGSISDEQFRYHISRGKNDFSSWIHEVLGNEECSKALARVKTKKTALRVLGEYIKNHR